MYTILEDIRPPARYPTGVVLYAVVLRTDLELYKEDSTQSHVLIPVLSGLILNYKFLLLFESGL